jgi:hypothetical protein
MGPKVPTIPTGVVDGGSVAVGAPGSGGRVAGRPITPGVTVGAMGGSGDGTAASGVAVTTITTGVAVAGTGVAVTTCTIGVVGPTRLLRSQASSEATKSRMATPKGGLFLSFITPSVLVRP